MTSGDRFTHAGSRSNGQLPFGVADLDPEMQVDPGPPKRIRCFVRDCRHWLLPPSRRDAGETCPEHRIRCHSSGTYSYPDARHNLIVDANTFANQVIGHPFKYESNRFGQENSEDAITWNVFRTLQQAGKLHCIANEITGHESRDEPKLFLWGLTVTDDTFEPWPLLIEARERFETRLPVRRPLTEPDIALYLPGKYLILIEAKFTSRNPSCTDGPRKSSSSLTKSELLEIYWHDKAALLIRDRGQCVAKVHYQLWRNLIFAEWMAQRDGSATSGYLCSLTQQDHDTESCREFAALLRDGYQNRFRQLSWEGMLGLQTKQSSLLANLAAYLKSKTASLRRAFELPV